MGAHIMKGKTPLIVIILAVVVFGFLVLVLGRRTQAPATDSGLTGVDGGSLEEGTSTDPALQSISSELDKLDAGDVDVELRGIDQDIRGL